MHDDDASRRYTDEEARAIFERALVAQADSRIGHEELVAAAGEVGLSRQQVELAIAEMEIVEAERAATKAVIERRRRGLKNHLVPFLAVNSFLFLVNWLTTPGAWWFLFPLFGWGLGMFFHAWVGLSRRVSPRALRRELARSEKQKRRTLQELLREQERVRQQLRRQQLQDGAKALGEAVEGGVVALLGRLAHELGDTNRSRTGVRVEAEETADDATPAARAADKQQTRG